jgi:type VI secretion system secreted protein Hcp
MAFDAFLKIDGITGESNHDKHKGEIDVLAFSWNIVRGSVSSGDVSGAAKVSDFSIVKQLDMASPQLFASVCEGKTITEATLSVERVGPRGEPNVFYKVKFEELLISTVSPTGGGGDRPTEQVSLTFHKATISAPPNQFILCDFSPVT